MKIAKFASCLVLSFAASTCFAQSNPVPFVNQPLVPGAVTPGSLQFLLTVNGAGFVSGSAVNWNGTPLATTFVRAGQLTAVVPATMVSKAGTVNVTVVSPSPGGGSSNPVPFTIVEPTSNLVFRASPVDGTTTPINLVTADFNHDGIADLAVIDQGPTPSCNYQNSAYRGSIAILLGNGDGTFTKHSTLCFPDFRFVIPQRLAVAGDVNRDGNVDLVAVYNNQAPFLQDQLAIYRGNGDGTFSSVTDSMKAFVAEASAVTTFPYIKALALGDFANNGQLDIAVSQMDDFGDFWISFNPANVSLLDSPITGTSATSTGPLSPGDFNGDGKLDLAAGIDESSGIGPALEVFLNTGTGTLTGQPAAPFALGTPTVSGDFNGDGILDLATTNGNTLSVLLGKGDGTFSAKTGQPVSAQTNISLSSDDFNGDGKLDLAVVDSTNTVSIWLGNGDGTFQAPLDTTGRGDGVVAADFNGDGRMDLAVTDSSNGTVTVLLQGLPYQAFVEPPVDADGTSVFPAKRGVIPLKFTLSENGVPTCTMPPATIAVARTAGGPLGTLDPSSYKNAADTGSNLRIDRSSCQYVYNLATRSLGAGTYRAGISIDGLVVGYAVFHLR